MFLSDGTELPFSTMVWNAGLAPVKFIEKIDNVDKGKDGRLIVDEYLRTAHAGVFAIGDAANCPDKAVPPIAQKAQQEGKYLAKALNQSQCA